MKSKGFTLTEILAVIVILAILVGIGTPVYYTISNNTRNNEYKTKKDYLKAQAIKYAEENNVDSNRTITVSTLVQNGYVVADDYVEEEGEEIPFITNPVDSGENLACRIINITIDGYDRNAEVTDDSNCDIVLQEVIASSLGIRAFKYSDNKLGEELHFEASNLESFEWSNLDVALVVNVNIDSFVSGSISHNGNTQEIDAAKIMNVVKEGVTVRSSDTNVIIVSAVTILKDTVSVSMQSKEGSDTVAKSASVEVKIDKEEPIVSSTSYSGWTSKDSDEQKTLSVYLSDGNGSGPALVYLTKNADAREINDNNKYSVNENGQATVNHGYQESGSDIVPLLENGDYYIWGEDKVENITATPKKVTITNVDKIPPKCTIRVYDGNNQIEEIDNDRNVIFNYTGWTRNPITVVFGCLDEESGCKIDMSGGTVTFNNTTMGVYNLPQYKISDNAGNEVMCYQDGQDVDVYHDTIPPEDCPVGGEKTTWTNTPVTITYGCGDSGVGCDPARSGGYKVYPLEPKTLSIRQTVLPEWVVSDQLGNTKTCYPGGKTIDVYYDKKPPEISPKNDPLNRNRENYNLLDNVNYNDPDSGIATVFCDPANTSQKGNTGSYNVECTAIDKMGNSAKTTFLTRHEYNATYNPKTCTRTYKCHCRSCSVCNCGYEPVLEEHACGGYNCFTSSTQWRDRCKCAEEHTECCSTCSESYDCSFYTCPLGGTLTGSICRY